MPTPAEKTVSICLLVILCVVRLLKRFCVSLRLFQPPVYVLMLAFFSRRRRQRRHVGVALVEHGLDQEAASVLQVHLTKQPALLALSSHASSLLQLNTYTARYPLTGRLVLPKVGRLIESVNSLMT
ncbi:hypothetical protein ARSEF1564_004016 [Beauveria bassiana]